MRVAVLVLTVDGSAIALGAATGLTGTVTSADLLRFGLLAVLSLAYQEVSRQVEHRRRLFAPGGASHIDMISVWALAGAIVLPPGLVAALVALMYGQLWARSWKAVDGVQPYRVVYSASAIALSCFAVSGVLARVYPQHALLPAGAGTVLAVALAIVVFRAVNAGAISLAIVVSGGAPRLSALFGSVPDNALEFATLVLGGATAVAVIQEPWFAVLVLPAAFVLQHHALLTQLVEAATVDTKTELLNSAAWHKLAGRELGRAERLGQTAAVFVIDMDHFKLVNDTHGHLAGDEALHAVGAALAEELRGYDAVGRFGGEEFVALLPDVTLELAAPVAERVRSRIASLRVPPDGDELRLSASIGIAVYPQHGTDLSALIGAADRALYAAKDAGRNVVRVADAARA